uniref:Putative secreted protein n=1 Tax=Amblyomma triste TaxID=251400 RepID=A0A023G5C5_AMBTT
MALSGVFPLLVIFTLECTTVADTEDSHAENEGNMETDSASANNETSETLYLPGMTAIYNKVVKVLEADKKLDVLVSATGPVSQTEQTSIVCLESIYIDKVADSWVLRTFGSTKVAWDIWVNPEVRQRFPTVGMAPRTNKKKDTDELEDDPTTEQPGEEQPAEQPDTKKDSDLWATFANKNCFILQKTQTAPDAPYVYALGKG